MRKRITPLLVAILAMLPLAIVGLAAVSSSATMRQVQLEHMRAVLDAAAEDAVARTEGHLEPAAQTVRVAVGLAEAEVIDFTELEAAEAYLLEEVMANPSLHGVFWAGSDGSYLHVSTDSSGAPGGYRTRWIDGSFPDGGATITIRDADGGIVSGYLDSTDTLDPRTRPWYIAAGTDRPAWSDPSTISNGGDLGIAVSLTVVGGPSQGVVGADVSVSAIEADLGSVAQATSLTSTAFIVEGERLIAHASRVTIGLDTPVPALTDVDDAVTRQVGLTATSGRGWTRHEINDIGYQSSTALDETRDWAVVVAGPEDEFTSRLPGLQRSNLATLIALAAAALVLAVPLARLTLRDVGSLRSEAQSDALTRLLNRRSLEAAGAKMVDAALRRRRSVGAIMVDIDHFKRLNDSYGHHAGDEILQAVAGRVANAVSRADVVGRLGGDELTVFVADSDLAATRAVANRIHNSVTENPISTHRGPIYVTVSLGAAATDSQDEPSLRTLMKAADRALYASKRGGRNRVTAVGREYQRS